MQLERKKSCRSVMGYSLCIYVFTALRPGKSNRRESLSHLMDAPIKNSLPVINQLSCIVKPIDKQQQY